MKKNVLRAVYLLLVFVLIASLGANQAKADVDTPVEGQNDGDEAYFLNYQPIDEAANLDLGESSEIMVGEEMPQLAAGAYRLNFSGAEFKVWNPGYLENMQRTRAGCVGIKFPGETTTRIGATLPLSIPAGSTIYSIVFTGVDNFTGTGRHLELSLRRYLWNGTGTYEVIKELKTTDAFASANPFWMNAVNINHVVSPDYTYYLYIDMFPVWSNWSDLEKLNICQLGIEYYPPTPFVVAVPTVMK